MLLKLCDLLDKRGDVWALSPCMTGIYLPVAWLLAIDKKVFLLYNFTMGNIADKALIIELAQ